MNIIAHIHTDLPTKFGVPRQSGLVDALKARIVFTELYRDPEALRGIEDFTHIWLIWEFSQAKRDDWSPTVRPPRLGGNRRLGVFATRSPFRPNAIGLSCVKLERTEKRSDEGTVLIVSGADLLDGTPIFDIKPYLPFTDCHTEATGGYASENANHRLQVLFPETLLEQLPSDKRQGLWECLADDPRPSYQDDPNRIYGMRFGSHEIKFTVNGDTLEVIAVEKALQ